MSLSKLTLSSTSSSNLLKSSLRLNLKNWTTKRQSAAGVGGLSSSHFLSGVNQRGISSSSCNFGPFYSDQGQVVNRRLNRDILRIMNKINRKSIITTTTNTKNITREIFTTTSTSASTMPKPNNTNTTKEAEAEKPLLKEPVPIIEGAVQPNSEEIKTSSPLSTKQKLKNAIKDYGSTVIIFHVTISLMSLGFFYLLFSSGLDMMAFAKWLGFGENLLQSKLTQGASTFVVAYAVHKVFSPLRIGMTLTCTPIIVKSLRKRGILKKTV